MKRRTTLSINNPNDLALEQKTQDNPPPPTTPHSITESAMATSMTEAAQQTLMLKTYSLVGTEYMDALVDEVRTMTKAQTVLIQQVMTMDECNDIAERLERQGIKVTLASLDDSSVDHDGGPEEDLTHCLQLLGQKQQQKKQRKQQKQQHQDEQNGPHNNQLLITRACSSSISTVATSKYCVVPVALLYNTPCLDTLINGTYISFNDHQRNGGCGEDGYLANGGDHKMDCSNDMVIDTFVPPHKTFVGVRLQGPNSLPLGLLVVCDDELKDDLWCQDTYQLISSVSTRVMQELAGIRDSERLVKAKDDATQDAENKIKFLADMSHEIRTPMNAVIALTDLLLQERSSLNDEQIEHLDVIQTSGHHLLTVTNDILDISKINHDPKFKLENRRFSLRKCIKDALNMARHQASMSQLNKMVYVVECPPDTDDNVSVQQTISSMERNGLLPLASQHKGKVLLPLIWNIDPDVPDYLAGDTMRLTQIILNLCSNAVKFTKNGGIRVRIKQYVPTPLQPSDHQSKFKQRYEAKLETIYTRAMQGKETKPGDVSSDDDDDDEGTDSDGEARPEKTILEICVTDTGIGIPADRLPRLFKSFSQIDISTARRYGGTGLGLAISSTLVNRMGGGLWVESEEGEGSKFALTLPMTIAFGRHARTYGSESTAAGSFITSPPSPSSSVSDGGGSVNSGIYERSDASSCSIIAPAQQSSNSSPGYFPSVPSHQQGVSQVNSMQHRLRQQSSWSFLQSRQQQQQQQQQQQFQQPLTTPLSESLPEYSTHPLATFSSSPTKASSSHQSMANRYSSSSDTILHAPRPATSPTPYSQISAVETKTEQKRPVLLRGDASQSCTHQYQLPERGSPTSIGSSGSGAGAGGGTMQAKNTGGKTDTGQSTGRTFRGGTSIVNNKHYHQRKGTGAEENFALMYPIKILLAEDNVLNQKIAISILKRLGYHDVVVTNNGKEALDIMQKIKFDVVFMDLYMPEMDGLEATREIIAERNGSIIPNANIKLPILNVDDVYIIALTASASNQDRQICIDAGMNDFISKPFTMMEMKASLKTCGSKRAKRRKQRREEQAIYQQQQQQQQQQQSSKKLDTTKSDDGQGEAMTGVECSSNTNAH
ncbi:unnamed protein product [Absidia cylindrospora]